MAGGLVTMHIDDARKIVADLFDHMDSRGLPLPHSIGFDDATGRVEVSWMLRDDLEGSRWVLNAFPTWTVHSVSKPTEPVLEHDNTDLEITIWAHPESVTFRAEIQ